MGAWEEGAGARGARREARRGDGHSSSARRGNRESNDDEGAEGWPEEEDEIGVELNQMPSTYCKNSNSGRRVRKNLLKNI